MDVKLKSAVDRIQVLEAENTELKAQNYDLHVMVDLRGEEIADCQNQNRVLKGQLQNIRIDRRYVV